MKRRYFDTHLLWMLVCIVLVSSCKEEEYALPTPKSGLQNDVIKRTLGPNVVGLDIEFAYAMAILPDEGKLSSARVEASIPGAAGTRLENNAFYTNGSGADVPVQIGEPGTTEGSVSQVTFNVDTSAATLRYYYIIPEEARGKEVSFKFSATSSNGQTVSYSMGPYKVTNMDIVRLLPVVNNGDCYISIADMAVYDETEAAANADKIDLVYLYRASPAAFAHALVSPAADAEYLPAGVNKSTRLRKAWNLQDFHLAQLQFGVYIDEVDFEKLDLSESPNYALGLKAEAGTWVETADGKYRAYIFVNSVNNGGQSAVISIKRLQMF
jgi:hypothetical protein